MCQKSFAGILQNVEHILKSLCPSIIGVGHVVDYLGAAEVSHAVNLLFAFHVGRFVAQGINVTVVHAQNPVEAVEIFRAYRARTVCQLVTSAAGVSPHTFIGQFSFVKTADACGINFKLFSLPARRTSVRMISSAEEERQMLPRQTNNILCFIIYQGVNTV